MTRTSQLDAHYAVIQVDGVLRQLVMSFQPTAELLIEEVRERAPGDDGRRRLRELLTRYRSGVLELADTLVALRRQCGTDKADLPAADDDDVCAELARLRAAHEKADRAGRQPANGYRHGSPELAAAADEALDTLRHGGAL
jgi:hypothetical protein